MSHDATIADLLRRARQALADGDPARAEQAASEALARDPACVEAYQALAHAYLRMNDPGRAAALLDRREELPKTGAFSGWGEVAEQLDRLGDAAGIYADHLSRFPRDAAAHYRLGLVALATDDRERAKTAFLGAVKIDPALPQPAAELARLYEEEGLLGAAAEMYDRALTAAPDDAELQTHRDLLDARLRELRALPDVRIEPAERAAAALYRLFPGRDGVHARQWMDDDGRIGYAPVHEPLTEQALAAHVRGDLTAGVYPVRTDATVRFLAFDIDIARHALTTATDPERRAQMDALVVEDARRIGALLQRLGLPYAVESSGYKGAHVWVCFAGPVPAARARLFARTLEKQAGPPPPDIQREVFPKQDEVAEGQLGNLIKLPLGVHKKTGRRAVFMDGDGRVYADQVAYLESLRPVEPAAFDRAIAQLVDTRTVDAAATGPKAATPAALPAAATTTFEALGERFPALAPVWERCAVVRALIHKAQTTHHLAHAERVVLACLFAPLGDEGVALIHAVIANCLDYSPEITQYQIGRTHARPISCPRMRHHIPEVTAAAGCACEVTLPEGGYPSPVLFARPDATRGQARPKAEQPEIDKLIERYVRLLSQWRALRRELDAAAAVLRERLERAESGTLTTDTWRVSRDPATGELRVELRSPS